MSFPHSTSTLYRIARAAENYQKNTPSTFSTAEGNFTIHPKHSSEQLASCTFHDRSIKVSLPILNMALNKEEGPCVAEESMRLAAAKSHQSLESYSKAHHGKQLSSHSIKQILDEVPKARANAARERCQTSLLKTYHHIDTLVSASKNYLNNLNVGWRKDLMDSEETPHDNDEEESPSILAQRDQDRLHTAWVNAVGSSYRTLETLLSPSLSTHHAISAPQPKPRSHQHSSLKTSETSPLLAKYTTPTNYQSINPNGGQHLQDDN